MGIVLSAVARISRSPAGWAKSRCREFMDTDEDSRSKKPSTVVHVRPHASGLRVPQFNTTIRVIIKSKIGDGTRSMPIHRCPQSPAKFVVLFDEDDVDFEVEVDNLDASRHCGVLMVMNHRIGKFIIQKYSQVPIKSLEVSGNKFHFSRVARETELEESKNHLKIETPTAAIGHIGISIRYSVVKQDPGTFTIRIKPLRGRPIFMDVCSYDKILSVKERIEEDVGFPVYEQRLVRDGKLLENQETLENCGIFQGDEIFLVRKLSHHRIAELVSSVQLTRCTFTPKIQVATEANMAKIRFETDDDIEVMPFLLELRMNPRSLNGSKGGKFYAFLRRLMNFF